MNSHSFYQSVEVKGGESGKTERAFHHPFLFPPVVSTHSLVELGGRAPACALGERALVLTLAQRLVSTLERPGSVPEVLRALGGER